MAFGDFTVTRASTKLRIGSNGLYGSVANNVPAFEFNTDGTYRGLLVEPGATNLALRSQEFNDAYWTKETATISANAETAPDGATTADKLIGNDLSTSSSVLRSVTVTASQAYTWSAYIKAGGATWARLTATGDVTASRIFINLSTGALGTVSGVFLNASVLALPNGWYRVSGSVTPTGTGLNLRISNANSDNTDNFTGNGVDGIFIWQAQLETGSVATSPIVTAGSTVARVADVVTLTGASSLIGQTEGTIVAEVQISSLLGSVGRTFLDLNAGSNNNRLFLGFTGLASNTIRGLVSANNAPVGDQRFVVSASGILKTAFAYKSSDSVLYVNGVAGSSTANSAISFTETLAEVRIGDSFGGLAQLNGHIRSISVFPTRLANATLQAITA
jgi:hypothetical protein